MIGRRDILGGAAALGATAWLSGAAGAQDAPGSDLDRIGATRVTPPPPGVPQLGLRHAFSVSIVFRERVRIQSLGGRVFVPAAGGEVWGERLQGRVLPYSGADYAGAHGLDASYVIEARDGALIYINNHGFMKRMDGSIAPRTPAPPRARGQVPDQSFVAPPDSQVPLRMRLAPVFDAPIGAHDWMNRTVFVGHGQRYMNPDHTIFNYYEVL